MSLLFDVMNAITGTREEPATHHMPGDCRHLLIHMANRAGRDHVYRFGLALLSVDADLGIVTVRKCIREMLSRGWLKHAGWSGPRNAAVRCFLVCTSGEAWPVSTSHVRLSPPQRRAVTGDHPGPTPGDDPSDEPPSRGDDPDAHGAITRPDAGRLPGPTPGDDKPRIYPPDLPPDLPPKITGPDPGGELSLFPDEGSTATPIPGSSTRRRRRDPQEPKAEDRYADAYQRAHADAGFPITALPTAERRLLGAIAKTHARYRDDTPITGEELLQWIYRRARAFRREVPDPSRHRGGASAFGFRSWLDNGGDGEERPLAPGQVDAEPPPDEIPPEVRAEFLKPPTYAPSEAMLERSRADVMRIARGGARHVG